MSAGNRILNANFPKQLAAGPNHAYVNYKQQVHSRYPSYQWNNVKSWQFDKPSIFSFSE